MYEVSAIVTMSSASIKHSYARQLLADKGITLFCGRKRVLTPVRQIYDIRLPNTNFKVGTNFVKQEAVKKFYSHHEIRRIGLAIVSEKVNERTRFRRLQVVKYVLVRVPATEDYEFKVPKDHHVEYDEFNQVARIIGKFSGPMGCGDWTPITLRPYFKNVKRKGVQNIYKELTERPDNVIMNTMTRWAGIAKEPIRVKIPELPFMVTKTNEIVCIPDLPDMPSILVAGMKGCQIGTDTVLMDDFTFRPIKDIGVGDKVLSPQKNGCIDIGEVVMKTSWYCDEVYNVMVDGIVLYTCSYNHKIPFLFKGSYIDITAEEYAKYDDDMKEQFRGVFCSPEIPFNTIDELFINNRKKVEVVNAGGAIVYGITIDTSSQWYITNDYNVTHNSGKSFLVHSLCSRYFWKPRFNYYLTILNDSSRETGSWSLPNSDTGQIYTLRNLNERPLPLPCVYLHPKTDAYYEKLFMDNVGFEVTLPFTKIVNENKKYLNLGESEKYFSKIKNDLLNCRSEMEAMNVLENMSLENNIPMQSANKIRAELETLFASKMTDISNKGLGKWVTSVNNEIPYNPLTAVMLSGCIPVLVTEYISNYRNLLSIYFAYFCEDLFMRQRQDKYMIRNKTRLLFVVDESHNISKKGERSWADMLLRRCVREGRPRNIGTLLATQKFGELPDVIKDNTTYLFVFKNPGEAGMIAAQYNLGKTVANTIKDLGKHELIAYTSDYFIVYDKDGNKRKSKINEVFIGYSLPPYSQHKKPTESGGEDV